MTLIISSAPASGPEHGFTNGHWTAIADFANDQKMVLIFRAGKRAAVPWIEQDFPAKPLEFKIKVDPSLGLLVARTDQEKAQVGAAGHWVLRVRDSRNPNEFVAYDPRDSSRRPIESFFRTVHAWAQEDLVIHRVARKPFTSDYDLSAVIPQDPTNWYVPTLVPFAGKVDATPLTRPSVGGKAIFSAERLAQLTQAMMNPTRGWGNPTSESVRAGLNRVLGSERILHGPQVLRVDPARFGSSQATIPIPYVELTSGDNEDVIAFRPGRRIDLHFCKRQAAGRGILLNYLPIGVGG